MIEDKDSRGGKEWMKGCGKLWQKVAEKILVETLTEDEEYTPIRRALTPEQNGRCNKWENGWPGEFI